MPQAGSLNQQLAMLGKILKFYQGGRFMFGQNIFAHTGISGNVLQNKFHQCLGSSCFRSFRAAW